MLMKDKKPQDKQDMIRHLENIILEARREGKSREAVDAIKTLASMKGWSKGDELSTNTIVLDLAKIQKVTAIAIGAHSSPDEKQKIEKLEAFYAKHYKTN